MKTFSEMKKYLQDQLTEETVEFDLDGKTETEIQEFLELVGIDFELVDGIFYLDEENMEDDGESIEIEDLQETSAKRKIVIRQGRKKIIFKCGPGKKKVGRTCVVQKSSNLMKMKMRAKRSAKKARTKRPAANRKIKISMKRRSNMGLRK